MKKVYRMIFGRFSHQPEEIFFASRRKMRRYWLGIISYKEDAERIDYCCIIVYTEEHDGTMSASTEHAMSDNFEKLLAKAKDNFSNQ